MKPSDIEILLNGEPATAPTACTVQQLLEKQPLPARFAIAVNGTFLPRKAYAEHELNAGDAVDIVSPIAGG